MTKHLSEACTCGPTITIVFHSRWRFTKTNNKKRHLGHRDNSRRSNNIVKSLKQKATSITVNLRPWTSGDEYTRSKQ